MALERVLVGLNFLTEATVLLETFNAADMFCSLLEICLNTISSLNSTGSSFEPRAVFCSDVNYHLRDLIKTGVCFVMSNLLNLPLMDFNQGVGTSQR